ncbi:hypothetical protein YC2023_083540 [Brassica napus]
MSSSDVVAQSALPTQPLKLSDLVELLNSMLVASSAFGIRLTSRNRRIYENHPPFPR